MMGDRSVQEPLSPASLAPNMSVVGGPGGFGCENTVKRDTEAGLAGAAVAIRFE